MADHTGNHLNLFSYSGDSEEVYKQLRRDSAFSLKIQTFHHLSMIFCIIMSIIFLDFAIEWLWVVGAFYFMFQTIMAYIDSSNRNWAMHIIDWIENNRQTNYSP